MSQNKITDDESNPVMQYSQNKLLLKIDKLKVIS